MYSQELINEVRELYPQSKEMHKLAADGNTFLGRYLDDGSTGAIGVDTILKSTSLDELKKIAMIEKRKRELYAKWWNEYQKEKKIIDSLKG